MKCSVHSQIQFLQLLCCSIHHTDVTIADFVDCNWDELYKIADEHGVLAIIFDAIEQLPSECRPEMEIFMEWYGQVNNMEILYARHKRIIGRLASFYLSNNIDFTILKGYGLSLNYPKPNHRPIGDIDIYIDSDQRPAWKLGDRLIQDEFGLKVNNSYEHHTVFSFEGVTIENHYDFINSKSQKSNALIERKLKELIYKSPPKADKEFANVHYPNPDFNALFIVRHSAGNFCAKGLLFRQVLDWLLFVRAYHQQVDWNNIYSIYKQYNLHRYVNTLNAIGVKYLGFDVSIFPEIEKDEKLVERVFADIFSPEFEDKEDGSIIGGVLLKTKRWWHNRWKFKICSPDNMFMIFVYGFYAKLLKPAHFRD